ncbi:ATP-binding protein [Streptomyces rubellomurinus]|nr:ATP-binding protein [Streptomyces rubellomurinus]
MRVFVDGQPLAWARRTARDFLARARDAHRVAVSDRVMDTVQLVVSELATNARTYAPGPCLLELTITDSAVEVSVWDSEPTLPMAHAPDPARIGRHGLESVAAVSLRFEIRREIVGKRVTAAVALADAPAGNPEGPVT